MSPDEKRKRNRKRRLYAYGGLAAGLVAAYWYQPMRIDLVERRPDPPLPIIDPDSKFLFGPGTRILIVTAHPDDSEFYIGGTLSMLTQADLYQVICTDGDKAYYGPFADASSLRQTRREEATQAFNAWHGKGLTFLGYPDGRLGIGDDVVDQVVAKIREIRPDYILSFDPDYPPRISHRDHRNAGEIARRAALQAGIGKWLMMFSTNGPNYVVDVTDAWDAKLKLLAIHRSQFARKQEMVDNLVASFAEKDGERIGVSLGEGFRCLPLNKH